MVMITVYFDLLLPHLMPLITLEVNIIKESMIVIPYHFALLYLIFIFCKQGKFSLYKHLKMVSFEI